MHVNKLILGGGISGIAFAHFYNKEDYLIIEKSDRLGGLCKSFKVGDSIFDYSGHFMHFKDAVMKKYVEHLLEKHETGKFEKYKRRAGILMLNEEGTVDEVVDYPFQANIHQLNKELFLKCLIDFWNAPVTRTDTRSGLHRILDVPDTFEQALRMTLGDAITDIFFKPYNEKLYRTNLSELSADAMGRFIPNVHFDEVMKNIESSMNFGYNSTFEYSPTSGIQGVVDAFIKEKKLKVFTSTTVEKIDTIRKEVTVSYSDGDSNIISYDTLICTLPRTTFLSLCDYNTQDLKYANVTVHNITFKGNVSAVNDRCWLYIPDKNVDFYRVGFYSYMSKKENTSIYVETSRIQDYDNNKTVEEIVEYLKKMKLIAPWAEVEDSQILQISPAYVILENDTNNKIKIQNEEYVKKDVYFTGRYAEWIYSSIEDNLLHAKELAAKLSMI